MEVDVTETQVEAPQTKTTAPVVVDHDEAELQAAIAAAQAEESARNAPVETPNNEASATPTEVVTSEVPKSDSPKGDPTAAVIALRHKLKQAETERLLLQGQVQALSSVLQQGTPTTQAGEADGTPDTINPLQALHAEREALAARFDAGEITAKEWEQQRQALENQEWELRTAQFAAITQPAPATDLQLETATAKLEADYPVLQILTEEDLLPLAELAKRQAAREGKSIQAGAVGTLELRTRIAVLAQSMYGGGTQSQTPPAPPALSSQAQARATKLELAQSMPPDVSSMGAAASAAPLSEAELTVRMNGMTEDDQLALLKTMPGLTSKILGR